MTQNSAQNRPVKKNKTDTVSEFLSQFFLIAHSPLIFHDRNRYKRQLNQQNHDEGM